MRQTLSLGLISLLAACGTASTDDSCKSDEECALGFFCQSGACLCRTDDSCGAGQYCNPFGTCQVRPACLGNQDCDSGMICNSSDPSGGQCIPASECGASAHCQFGEFCSPGSHTCEPGCRRTGDCQLGFVCVAGACQPGGTSANCTVCPADPTPDATYCDFGETCSISGSCQAHTNSANLCATCSNTAPCPGNLICLIDNDQFGQKYCTTTCNIDLDCPNGYSGCGKVSLVFEECTNNGSCSNGAPCLGSAESQNAYCGCIDDTECSMGADVCFFGSCLNTGWPCSNDAQCGVSCVQYNYGSGTAGICLTDVGVCGKDSGYFCNDLRSGDASCIDFLP